MSDEEPYDSSDPKAVKERNKTAKQIQARRKETLLAIMGQKNGRDWLFYILERCHIYQSPFSSDALVMAHAVGEQNVGRLLLADMVDCSPELYLKMMQEREEDKDV